MVDAVDNILLDGAVHTAGHLPDPHGLSSQPDGGYRGDGAVFLERPAGLTATSSLQAMHVFTTDREVVGGRHTAGHDSPDSRVVGTRHVLDGP